MKILALTNLYPPHHVGGYELICRAVVDNLAARGHAVTVLTSDHREPDRSPGPEPHVRRRLRINGFYGHPWTPMRRLAGLETHNNRALRRAIADVDPDVVHVWAMGGLSKSMLVTLRSLGRPAALHVSDHWMAEGLPVDVWLAWWNDRAAPWRRRVIRGAASALGLRRVVHRSAPTDPVRALDFPRLYFCSRALRELTARAGLDVAHGEVIPPPVDVRVFAGVPAACDARVSRLLWVGRLCPEKGIRTALEALALLGDDFGGGLDVYGAGDAAYVADLRRRVRERTLPVTFTWAPPEAMPAVYRAHDALLFTSEWAEPFAVTPLEAMASGLPVIATTTGGSAELFRDGENALTYAAGDPRALADRVRALVSDGALRARIAARGQAEVRARFAEDRIVDRIEAYLTETVRTWRSRAPC